MDTKIINGDFVRSTAGLLQTVECFEELLQRVKIRLTVPLGSFACQPSLGSRLSLVYNEEQRLRSQRAVQLAQESLSEIPDVSVLSANVNSGGDKIVFKIMSNNQIGEVEVNLG